MNPDPPRSRYAPEPIETIYKSHRATPAAPATASHIRPTPPLTPEPSPPSSSPAQYFLRQRRRFAPQLIETSRRSHHLGDTGPATRPTDKTDITPYTNHIYTTKPRPKKRHGGLAADEDALVPQKQPTRRETEEEEVQEYLLELAAKEVERQIQEDALAAFPNSRAREGGVAHFYFPHGSSTDDLPAPSPPAAAAAADQGARRRLRRKTSSLDLSWWQKHMQQHAEKLAHHRGDNDKAERSDKQDVDMTSDSELDKMHLTVPPDAMWITSRRASLGDPTDPARHQTEARKWESGSSSSKPKESLHVLRGPAPESPAPDDRSQPRAQSPVHQPAISLNQNNDPFGRPFASLGIRPNADQLRRIRNFVSPPMLGKELKFRRCPSPKHTKLETDHTFAHAQNAKHENRDLSGKGGLWRGYCCRSESTGGYLVPAELHPPAMMATPRTPGTPTNHLSVHEADCLSATSDEPRSSLSGNSAAASSPTSASTSASDSFGDCLSGVSPSPIEYCRWPSRSREPPTKRGIQMLHGLDERLQQKKERAERDEKIASEFGDGFVTQVYNYLSLGYPAMARAFDEELSKISRVSVEELSRDDDKQRAKGYLLERKSVGDTPEKEEEEEQCPRWRALRVYILEWARQHPDLDNLNPLAWGVRERRGSWAL